MMINLYSISSGIANPNFPVDSHQEPLDDPDPDDCVHGHHEAQHHPQDDPHVLSQVLPHQGDVAEPKPYPLEDTPANQQNPELHLVLTDPLSDFPPPQTTAFHFLFAVHPDMADLALPLIPVLPPSHLHPLS